LDWVSYDKEVGGLLDEYNKLHFYIDIPIPMVLVNRLLALHYQVHRSIRELVLLATSIVYNQGSVDVRNPNDSSSDYIGYYMSKEELGRKFPYDNYINFLKTKGKSIRGLAIPEKKKRQGEKYEFIVKIVEKRKKLPDVDGSSYKYLIDSLGYLGLIYDDSPKYMKYIFRKQEVSKEESTLISIWRR